MMAAPEESTGVYQQREEGRHHWKFTATRAHLVQGLALRAPGTAAREGGAAQWRALGQAPHHRHHLLAQLCAATEWNLETFAVHHASRSCAALARPSTTASTCWHSSAWQQKPCNLDESAYFTHPGMLRSWYILRRCQLLLAQLSKAHTCDCDHLAQVQACQEAHPWPGRTALPAPAEPAVSGKMTSTDET